MKILETAKFSRLRKKIRESHEQDALLAAIHTIAEDPATGKFLKGEFKDLRYFRYAVKGQGRRIIYKVEGDAVILYSFGPRADVYKR
jgi:mRNA-degrading endonuclease RelE of RelBE toxin-antitoxin system